MVSIDNVPQWLSGIGTILAVIVALFQKSIHNILNKPKINISCKNVKQCMVEQNLEQNDSDSRGIIVRVKIENTGNYTADNAALFVDSFLQKRNSDGEYVKKEFPPKQMHDFLQDKPNIIAPNLLYYFDIIGIRIKDELTDGEISEKKTDSKYVAYLLGDSQDTELGKGSFIIPLKFFSTQINGKVFYFKIVWESDVYTTDKKFFDFEMISESDFNKLKIRE